MINFVAAILVVLALGSSVKGQVNVCPSVDRGDNCYFDGLATLPPSGASVTDYFVIGGLFDIHAKGTDAFECGSEISDKAILNLLAFFWAVNYYGNQLVGVDGNSVGAFAFDNCFRPEQTIENFLGFSQCKLFVRGIQENVVAYVGPFGNEDAVKTGMLASDLSITLVSPDANSYEFDKDDHRSLLRIRPNFDYDLKAIMAFLKMIGSEHVIVIYSEDSFYKHAYESFMEMLDMDNQPLCAHLQLSVSSTTDMTQLVKDQLEGQGALKYIVPLMAPSQVLKLMNAIASNPNVNDVFTYIFTSDIGRNKMITTDKVVVVEPTLSVSINEFNTKLIAMQQNSSLNGNLGINSLNNPWLSHYLAQAGKTQVPLLTDANLPSDIYMSVSRTIAAVKYIITGLDNGMQDCASVSGTKQMCDDLRNKKSAQGKINGLISNAADLSNSQPKADNVVYNYYVFKNEDLMFHKIGNYEAGAMKAELTATGALRSWFNSEYKQSACPESEACCVEPTTAPVTPGTSPEPTTEASTKPPSDKVQVDYPRGKEITGAYSEDSIERDYETRFDEGHKWVIALAVLAGLGILCVLVFEIYIMYKLLGTRMGNKWRTMWLGQLLLFGVFLAYLTLAAFIFVPTDATCGIIRFGVGVSYAICFAVLLVKLMVILTSKSTDVLLPGDGDSPNYLKGVYQFLMFVFAVGVQVVINVQWLIIIPPEAVQVMGRNGDKVWVCNHYTWETGKDMYMMKDFVRTNFENHILSLVYIMFLILITTVLSLKAHGIITNHRESVFIGIAAGFSIPIWLAWSLVGGLNKDHDYAQEFGDACMAFGLLLTVTLIMFAMFLPKVRQLVNMGVEGIYLEDDRDTYYAGSVIMAPPSYKSKGPSSVIYVNNQGIYSEPVVIGNGDPSKAHDAATHLKHPGSTYSAPPAFIKKSESTYGGSRVLRMTDDLKGRHPSKKSQSEVNYGNSIRSRSYKGTLPRSRSQSDLGAL